ncbi:MAG: hypothetical protein M1827_004218 [Pycnora praestabilis]|nr:MAG: hypothetical protein M1827_004218 [Pycnora praestabilis]
MSSDISTTIPSLYSSSCSGIYTTAPTHDGHYHPFTTAENMYNSDLRETLLRLITDDKPLEAHVIKLGPFLAAVRITNNERYEKERRERRDVIKKEAEDDNGPQGMVNRGRIWRV